MTENKQARNDEDERYGETDGDDNEHFEDASDDLHDFQQMRIDGTSQKTAAQFQQDDLFGDGAERAKEDEDEINAEDAEDVEDIEGDDQTITNQTKLSEWTEAQLLIEIDQLDLATLASRIIELDFTKKSCDIPKSNTENETDTLTNEKKLAIVRSLKESGNQLYAASEFDDAFRKYAQAIVKCPSAADDDAAILYSNAASCLMRSAKTTESADADANAETNIKASTSTQDSSSFDFVSPKMSKLDELALRYCDAALQRKPEYVKCLLKKAELCETNDGQLEEALRCYEQLCSIASRRDYETAESAAWKMKTAELRQRVAERNERMKTEMMTKLKQLGNLVLRPFGLSTENFKLERDSGGGYKVNFVSNSQRK